jgi:uncharacterized membrane protein YqjE
MNASTESVTGRGVLPLLTSMIGTRLELAAIDLEAHVQATLAALLAAFVATVIALIAIAFAGVAVIVIFWDTHRVAAAGGVTFAYVAFAAVVASRARAAWQARPAPLAVTMRELELDRDALRGRS